VPDIFILVPDDEMLLVKPAHGPADEAGPVDGHRVCGAFGGYPVGRFIRQIPGQDCAFVPVTAREFGCVVGLKAKHLRI
jgi:hypothetical protein